MLKFAANLTMLFTEVPFMERFSLAKEAGFAAVEFLFPYEYSLLQLQEELINNELKAVLFDFPAGDWAAGERGIASHPDRVIEFRDGIEMAVEYAVALGVKQINCLAGNINEQYSWDEQWDVLTENVNYAARILQNSGLWLVIEPINHFDMPNYFLNRTKQALALLTEVNMPNVFIQYDIYHAQREEGELIATIRKNIDKIAHIQIADNPGRHEPGTGEINYSSVFRALEAARYTGYIGLEYIPSSDTKSSLKWLDEFR